jgi:hypothetical protein
VNSTAQCPAGRSRLRQFGGEGEQSDTPSPLDCYGQLALMEGTVTGDSARNDFPSIGYEVPEPFHILEIDSLDLINAIFADLLPPKAPPLLQHSP